MNKNLIRELKNPSNKFRGKPFWSWNGELEEKELLRQIDCLEEMGFGGYFMHSRVGLITEYLGDKWFKLTNACADYGSKKGLYSYLYDEDRWPSGSAGGLVSKNPEYRQKLLTVELFSAEEFAKCKKDYVIAFSIDLKDDLSYTSATPLNKGESPAKGQKVAVFSVFTPPCRSVYNGYTYIDTMNRAATEEFIKLTHEKYVKKCGDRIGTSISAVFTDEPHRGGIFINFGDSNLNSVPFTPKIFDEYKARFKKDLKTALPELFFCKNGEQVSPVKWSYAELLQELFIENFMTPINDWCKKHNIDLTGHVLHEDSLGCQTATAGSMMRIYPHMGMPGVDVLQRNYNYWIVKQLSSAARQCGQETLLSELYGCTTWNFDFEGHKTIGDWQALFGINLRCPHLSWYTMQGEGKRDYPASISYQSAWYRDYKYVEDYFARMNTLLAAGKPECELLVINPVENMWARLHVGYFNVPFSTLDEGGKKLEKDYADTFMALSSNRIDFDYGDEGLLKELGKITKTGTFKVGKCSYKKVLVSGLENIRTTTFALLKKFKSMGGEVIFAGQIPKYLGSVPSDEVKEFAKKCKVVSTKKIAEACKSGTEVSVVGNNPEKLFAQVRDAKDEKYIVLINASPLDDYGDVELCLGKGASVCEYDLRNGKVLAIPFKKKCGKIYVTASFPKHREHAYILSTKDVYKADAQKNKYRRVTLQNEYSYELSEKNIYVMDYVAYKVGDSQKWSSVSETYFANRKVRNKLGLEQLGGEMLQPWYIKKNLPETLGSTKVALKYSFTVKNKPKTPVELVVECLDKFKITVNGTKISTVSNGKWVDNCYDRVTVPEELIKLGKNTVEMVTDFNVLSSVENAFIIGDFGVEFKGDTPVISKLPRKLCIGDIGVQGLPFYSGSVIYKVNMPEIRGKNCKLELNGYMGATVKVKNKKECEYLCWAPYAADISSIVKRSGKFEIEVTMTRANTFGHGILVPTLHSSTDGTPSHYNLLGQGLEKSPVLLVEE